MPPLWSKGREPTRESPPPPEDPARSHGAWDAPPSSPPPPRFQPREEKPAPEPPPRRFAPRESGDAAGDAPDPPRSPPSDGDAHAPPSSPRADGDAHAPPSSRLAAGAQAPPPPLAAGAQAPPPLLAAAPGSPRSSSPAGDGARSPRRPSLLPIALVAGAAVVLAVVVAVLLLGSDEPPATAAFVVPGHPTGLVAADGHVWVAAPDAGLVWELDADTGRPSRPPMRTGGTPARLALAAGGVWAGDTGDAAIVALAPTPARPLHVGPDVADIAVSSGAVWVASAADGTVRAIERDGRRRSLQAGAQLVALAADDRRVVALDAAAGTLTTIDARTREVSGPPIAVGGVPLDVALAGDSAWVVDARAGTVQRFDLRTRRPAAPPVAVGGSPVAVAADDDDVYVAVRGDDTLVRIDARSGKVRSRTPTGADPTAVALDPRYAWVSGGANRLLRVSRAGP